MGEAKRNTPDQMPDAVAVTRATRTLRKPYLVSGCRGNIRSKNRTPSFAVHSVLDILTDDISICSGRHAIVFVHGYNVSVASALREATNIFGNLQTSLLRDGRSLDDYEFFLFTWPGDVGPLWFSDAQEYAQHAGVALYELFRELNGTAGARSISLITHSLGAHVGLRSAAILAERLLRGKTTDRYDNMLLLAPAVENDVFHRPHPFDDYHFHEAPFAIRSLHLFTSRADEILRKAFSVSERDAALGYAGPETMKPLKSMTARVPDVLGQDTAFRVELHDFSPRSASIINPDLHAHAHSDYWERTSQTDYYINLLTASS